MVFLECCKAYTAVILLLDGARPHARAERGPACPGRCAIFSGFPPAWDGR